MAEVKTKLTIIDNASKKLETIEKALNKLNQQFSSLPKKTSAFNSAINKTYKVSNKFTNQLNKSNKVSQVTANVTNKNTKAFNGLSTSMKKATGQSSLLIGKLRMLASTYLGVMGASALIKTTDNLTQAENKFVTKGLNSGMTASQSKAFSENSMDKIFLAAQDSASGYMAMVNNVAKAVTLAGNSFGKTQEEQMDNSIRFQNVMAKTYALGGASDAEQSSSMYQLVQSLGAGKLQGDELRSLTEGAPLAAQAIEEFAQKVYNTDESLKDLGSQGLLTSDLVVAAILDMGDTADKQFAQMDRTFAQMWQMFKNDATKAFTPFMRKLREIGNSDDFAFLVQKGTEALYDFADVAMSALGKVEEALSWIRNNWETFETMLTVGIGILTFKIGSELTGAFVQFGSVAVSNINDVINWYNKLSVASQSLITKLGVIAIISSILVWGFNAMTEATESLAKQMGIFLVVIGLIIGVLLIFGIIAVSTIAIVVAVVALVLGALATVADAVLGGLYWLGALIVNIISGIINAIVQIFMGLIKIVSFVVEWIYNAFNGGFDGIKGGFANLIGQLIAGLIEFGKLATKIIDAVFGTNWTSELDKWSEEARSWGKTDDATTFDYPTEEVFRLDMTDAYDLGAKHGNQFMDWQQDLFGEGFDFGSILGDKLKNPLDGIDTKYSFDGGTDYLANIDSNTANMANSMELSEEDLKYLRLMAEQEAINKFTTAEIKVDMTNNNNVSKGTDLDGVVTHLAAVLREELVTLADGVHA